MIKPIFPTPTLLQGKRYIPSMYGVDVQKTWRAAGWKPSKPKAQPRNALKS